MSISATPTRPTGFDERDQRAVTAIRALSIDGVQQANSGHPGLPLGAAPMAYVLWTRFMRHNPHHPLWPDRDRFVLSAGHGSMLLYSLLHLTGYDLPLDEVRRFRQWGSKTPGHPEYRLTPGVEATTGPLGQGFGNGVGMAIAEAHLAATYNREGHAVVDHHTYGIVSDGDLQEGVAYETASLAGHLGLGKLIYLYDDNTITLAGAAGLAWSEDVRKRFEAQRWHVGHVQDGNDLKEIAAAVEQARQERERPSLVIVRTRIGYGSPNKAGSFEVHGNPLGVDEVAATKKHLGWGEPEPFAIPEDVRRHFAERVVEPGQREEQGWRERFEGYRGAFPDLARQFERTQAGELPEGWNSDLPAFAASEGKVATRSAGGKVINALAQRLPELVGGSADLNPSTNTALKGSGDFQAPHVPMSEEDRQGAVGVAWGYEGRNLHYGVREHGMGAITNGLAYHGGLIPFSATFFAFSDYMRPAMRLAALSELGCIFVFTHDSIGLGEDGPTHQPVEHLAAVRAIPHMVVLRPGDANEVVEAWRVAIERRRAPTTLVFTRQALPILDRSGGLGSAEGTRRGGYVLADASDGRRPDVVLIGTGSEVSLALEAREVLANEGINARVVSMPSWELFAGESQEYRDRVLPPEVTARVAVEAGSPFGWERWVGERGAVVALDRFGASAPYTEIYQHLGFTPENIAARARALLQGGERGTGVPGGSVETGRASIEKSAGTGSGPR